jgi:hypothetical protein
VGCEKVFCVYLLICLLVCLFNTLSIYYRLARTHYVDQVGIKLAVFFPQSLKCRAYRCVPPCSFEKGFSILRNPYSKSSNV